MRVSGLGGSQDVSQLDALTATLQVFAMKQHQKYNKVWWLARTLYSLQKREMGAPQFVCCKTASWLTCL
jgi:hypothetical protein